MKTLLFAIVTVIAISCGSGSSSRESANVQQDAASGSEIANKTENVFDINAIPVSNADIGSFPYLSVPEGYRYSDEHNRRYEEKIFFYNDSLIMTIGGKYYHARVYPMQGEEFSETYIVRNYEQVIKKLGGVEIYSGGIVKKASELLNKNSMTYAEDMYNPYPYNYKQFVLRTAGGNVWIELCHGLNANIVDFTVMYEGEVEETIKIIKADELKSAIEDSGKAILYINFDTDKATLKPDGILAVEEIAKLMQNNTSLKLSVEGHTDNTGAAGHNKKLSTDRAESVVKKLKESGIDADRLKSSGHGADRPLVDNKTEEDKAKNRRVEIVKFE